MASIKISELNELTEIDETDLLPIVDSSANETKKITISNMLTGVTNKRVQRVTGETPTFTHDIDVYGIEIPLPNGFVGPVMSSGQYVSRENFVIISSRVAFKFGSNNYSMWNELAKGRLRTTYNNQSYDVGEYDYNISTNNKIYFTVDFGTFETSYNPWLDDNQFPGSKLKVEFDLMRID